MLITTKPLCFYSPDLVQTLNVGAEFKQSSNCNEWPCHMCTLLTISWSACNTYMICVAIVKEYSWVQHHHAASARVASMLVRYSNVPCHIVYHAIILFMNHAAYNVSTAVQLCKHMLLSLQYCNHHEWLSKCCSGISENKSHICFLEMMKHLLRVACRSWCSCITWTAVSQMDCPQQSPSPTMKSISWQARKRGCLPTEDPGSLSNRCHPSMCYTSCE